VCAQCVCACQVCVCGVPAASGEMQWRRRAGRRELVFGRDVFAVRWLRPGLNVAGGVQRSLPGS